jgi:hypothetical protein
MYADNSSKMIVAVNRQLEPGRVMNAMSHALAGLVANITDKKQIEFLDYPSSAGWSSLIAKAPIIVLRSDNSGHLERLHKEAIDGGLPVNAFVHTMLGASADEQQQATLIADPASLEYWAVALFGGADQLKPLTKRFSLYK